MCNVFLPEPSQCTKIHVVLFTRFPEPGKTKTRLIPDIGAQAAAQLQKDMTEFTLRQVQEAFEHVSIHICYTGADQACMKQWLGKHASYWEQGQGDLGQRMARAVQKAFAHGAQKVLLLGADCPDNRAENLQNAVQLLDSAPCVIGPAHDGGYYLLALSQDMPHLFQHMAWGTSTVLADTLARLSHYRLLPYLHDVDYIQDIPPRISVVLPTLNEEEHIAQTIQSVLQGFHVEILVADGGSHDATCSLAQNLGARVISCPTEQRGRAAQMNLAAQQAEGDIVLFLHADSILPTQWDRAVRESLQDASVRLGYFCFAVSGNFWGKKLLVWGTHMRAKYLRRPYGDQGLFMRREDFWEQGGYATVPFLEDVLLVKQAAKKGKVRGLSLALVTSARRWQKHGFLKVTLLNQLFLLAAALGVNIHWLAAAYKKGSFFALLQKKP